MIAPAWIAAATAGATAIAAGLADRGRRRRRDIDAVGWIDWRTVQMAALIATMVAAGVALKG